MHEIRDFVCKSPIQLERKEEEKKKKQIRATIPMTMQISFGEAE